jgi:hypothetical protein
LISNCPTAICANDHAVYQALWHGDYICAAFRSTEMCEFRAGNIFAMERRVRLFQSFETVSTFCEKRAAEGFGPAARTYLQALTPPDIG